MMQWAVVAWLVLGSVKFSVKAQWFIVAWLGLLMAVETYRTWCRYYFSKPPLSIPMHRPKEPCCSDPSVEARSRPPSD